MARKKEKRNKINKLWRSDATKATESHTLTPLTPSPSLTPTFTRVPSEPDTKKVPSSLTSMAQLRRFDHMCLLQLGSQS